MSNRGYDVIVDVDAAVRAFEYRCQPWIQKLIIRQGDLGHTDLQEDLEFHPSSKPSMYIRH